MSLTLFDVVSVYAACCLALVTALAARSAFGQVAKSVPSVRFSLNVFDLWAFSRGTLVATAGAIVAWMSMELVPNIPQGTRAGIIQTAVYASIINLLRLFVTKNK